MNAVLQMALEHNKEDNAKCAELKEAYVYMDDIVSYADAPQPAIGKLEEALVLGDFPLYFNRVLSRMVYDRYQSRMGQWRDYTFQDMLPDYSVGERYTLGEFDRPVRTQEKMEPQTGYIVESELQLRVEDYTKQIDFSHRILVNDDMGAFRNIGQKMADSTKRFLDFYVSALYDNALTQVALGILGVNYAGTGALTTANLAIGYNAFVQRVDARGNPIVVAPKYLVIPPILRLTANAILQSEKIAELATNSINPLRPLGLEVREDPYIGFAPPNIPWYLFADPADIPGVSVVKMQQMPNDFYLFAKAPDKLPMSVSGGIGAANWQLGSFLTGDIEISVQTTIGSRSDDLAALVGVTDANGIYYSSGTTP
jgi:hypothetical protein